MNDHKPHESLPRAMIISEFSNLQIFKSSNLQIFKSKKGCQFLDSLNNTNINNKTEPRILIS
ncbi:hypothetical protein LJC73_04545 [Bacteroidales bacterium OttesenSCG-928-L14]|nr:hypothetical protein [Bacteroidales bacterium OttesenSCG-928-L14]